MKINQILREFAADDGSGGEEDVLHKYAKMWYNGDEHVQQQVEQVLDRMGWEIGEIESEEGGCFVVQPGDEHGDSYIGFAANDLTEDSLNEKDMGQVRVAAQKPEILSAVDDGKTITIRVRTHDGTTRTMSDSNPARIQQWLNLKYGLKFPANLAKKFVGMPVAEGSSNIGSAIKSLYQKIYNAGDDEIEYFYNDSPVFAQYWDEYEGDLDSIIAEVDPAELQVMLDELESYVQQANLAEGRRRYPPDPQNYDSDQDYYDDLEAYKRSLEDDDVDYENFSEPDDDWFDESKEKVGNMDADAFDDAIGRLKKLAGAGPLKTVYDPAKRVYRNVPTAQQPAKQPQK